MNLKSIEQHVSEAVNGLAKLSDMDGWTPALGSALTQLRVARATLAGHQKPVADEPAAEMPADKPAKRG